MGRGPDFHQAFNRVFSSEDTYSFIGFKYTIDEVDVMRINLSLDDYRIMFFFFR